MPTTCTRCDASGFLNIHQLPDSVDGYDIDAVMNWVADQDIDSHDVQVCDCCGDGKYWHGTPGEHYGNDDPVGNGGPYAYNGGLCECH